MANINKQWKRILVVGCSHGHLADPDAIKAVLEFKSRWKPQFTVHLGDFLDLACCRSGANGTPDQAVDPTPDLQMGLEFLNDLRPQLVFSGNHEGPRLRRLMLSGNALISRAALSIQNEIDETIKTLKAEYIPYTGVWQHRKISDFKLLHGYMYGENATRDHAEKHGKCITSHTHRASQQAARRDDDAMGYNVGTLSNIPCMEYAANRASTLAWRQGFVWGEFCDNSSSLWLHTERTNTKGIWRLPL